MLSRKNQCLIIVTLIYLIGQQVICGVIEPGTLKFPTFELPSKGQEPNNQNGSQKLWAKYALEDESNDDAARMSAQEIILRSGYKYRDYDVVADDGYITTITRLINPLADRAKLRRPPILMMHGGSIDPTAYLIASSIQHHPEPWPRASDDPPMTSWNRSLAFVLANNGFDVWLAETRGSSEKNRRHLTTKALSNVFGGGNVGKNMTMGETVDELLKQWNYWAFNQDDIINHEVKAQFDLVSRETGSEKLLFFTFSLSTPISLAFLSVRPDYAERVQGFVSMAPIISGYGTNGFIKTVFQTFCPLVPDSIGTLVISDGILTQPARELVLFASKPKQYRYSVVKLFLTFLAGPSPKYATLLELNVLGHLLRNMSFREVKQMCQQMAKNRLAKFDYGPIKNKLVYNQTSPPIYDLSNLNLKSWILVSGANDKLSTLEMVEDLIKLVNPKPAAKIVAPGMNHLDLFAGVENDRYINIPVLKYLESRSTYPAGGERNLGEGEIVGAPTTSSRQLDLTSLLPTEVFQPDKLRAQSQKFAKTLANMTSMNPTILLETIQNGFADLANSLGFNNFLPKLSTTNKGGHSSSSGSSSGGYGEQENSLFKNYFGN